MGIMSGVPYGKIGGAANWVYFYAYISWNMSLLTELKIQIPWRFLYKYSAPTELTILVAGPGPYCDLFYHFFLTPDPIAYTYFILTVPCVALRHKSETLSPAVYVVNSL